MKEELYGKDLFLTNQIKISESENISALELFFQIDLLNTLNLFYIETEKGCPFSVSVESISGKGILEILPSTLSPSGIPSEKATKEELKALLKSKKILQEISEKLLDTPIIYEDHREHITLDEKLPEPRKVCEENHFYLYPPLLIIAIIIGTTLVSLFAFF